MHPTHPRLADGSGNGHRMESACVRAIDAWMRLAQKASDLLDLLDNVTSPGVVRTHLSEDDSLVIAIQSVTAAKG